MMSCGSCAVNNRKDDSTPESWKGRGIWYITKGGWMTGLPTNPPLLLTANMPHAQTRVPTHRSTSYSPVQENNFNIDHFSHARHDASRPYPTLGNVMDRTSTADPNEGFTDLGSGCRLTYLTCLLTFRF
jgi:hypothetical protein